MADSTKITRKVAAQIQSGSTYESAAMRLMPFTAETLSQNYDPIEDPSIVGVGFKDIPQQGVRHIPGSLSQNLDAYSCIPIFEAAFGANAANVFTLGSNSKKLSICTLDAVNAIRYANVYLKTMKISSSPNDLWKLDYDAVGITAEDRGVVGNFPSAVSPYDPFVHHEAGGVNGYVRIGDASDALSSADDVNIEDFNLDISVGFDEQFANSQQSLTPVFGQVPPSVSGSFTIPRHSSETYLNWRDNHTPLQMSILIYKNATNTILIEIPRFVVGVDLTDDDVTKQNIAMHIGRNGVGSTYKNTYMSFVSPVRITVVNS